MRFATRIGAQSATHFGAQSATRIGAQSATHIGAQSATHFGAQSATHFGAQSAIHIGAQSATHIGARSATRIGAKLVTRVDLHTHTTVSDGTLSPRALLELAAERSVTVIAITDHDTTEGVPEATAAGEALGIEVVPGIELSCDLDDTVADDHADILGYFIDIDDPDFQALLTRILTAREDRARRMVAQLQAIGAPIAFSDVAAISRHGAIGRPHVAHALVEAGFVEDVPTAFHKYIGRGRAGYADRYRLTPADACAAIRAAGGVPVLAHPVPPNNPWRDPKHLMTFLPPLAEAGLGGLECHYPGYTVRVVRWLNVLAKHFGLVPTGGSDYHGPWRAGRELGSVDVPADTPARLRQAAEGSR